VTGKSNFCVSRRNNSSLPDPKTTQSCPRAQENPKNDSSKFHWLPKPHKSPKILQNPLKKSPFHPTEKTIKTHQIFLQKSSKVAAQKNRLNFPRNDSREL
jgi:hypothetical protein